MTSSAGNQIILIHILPNISRRKDNQAMKFVQFIQGNVKINFLQKSCKNGTERLVSDLFVSIKKLYMR